MWGLSALILGLLAPQLLLAPTLVAYWGLLPLLALPLLFTRLRFLGVGLLAAAWTLFVMHERLASRLVAPLAQTR